MNDFNLTEDEVAEFLQDGNFSLDDLDDDFEEKSLSLSDEDDNKPKGLAFKAKAAVCLLALIGEAATVSFCGKRGLSGRSLRYFLLSESGSLEA